MASMAEEEHDLFDDEEDDDDSQFDSEDDYAHDEAAQPPPPTFPSASGEDSNPISSFSSAHAPDLIQFSNPNLDFNPAFNGAAQALYAPTPEHHLFASPSPGRKRQRTAASEENRRVFQKLWTDEDEIAILQGFLEFTTQRGTAHADYQYDTGPFFDQIRTRLQLEFNKNQLVEKLRRLKRKYRNAASRIAAGKESVFKNPHDRATFEISQKIWSSSFKRVPKRRAIDPPAPQSADLYTNGAQEIHPQLIKEEPVEVTVKETIALPPVAHTNSSLATPTMSAIEETVRSCLSPLFKELLQCVNGGAGGVFSPGLALNSPLQLNMPGSGAAMDERWKQQQILELEVFLKRTELVQDQIRAALEELRSEGADPSDGRAVEAAADSGAGGVVEANETRTGSDQAALEELRSEGADTRSPS